MSPRQGHHATGLCSHFSPHSFILFASSQYWKSGSHRAIPSGCVTNNHQPAILCPFPPSFLPHSNSLCRLITYHTSCNLHPRPHANTFSFYILSEPVTLLGPIFLSLDCPLLLRHSHYLIIALTTLCLPLSGLFIKPRTAVVRFHYLYLILGSVS